jgi:hypothetical protein
VTASASLPPPSASRRARAAILAGWAVVALLLAATHVHWRDEVRAFSIALSGDTVPAMLRNLHGEGHPALWYLLLRVAHDLVPMRQVLPVLAFAIGLAMAALLAFRAPFPARTLALALSGYWSVFEYTVSARNYGIAAALMFLWAALYKSSPASGRETAQRRRGRTAQAAGNPPPPSGLAGHLPLPGLILALLCNTSAPAILFAGALALFWTIDLLQTQGLRWTRATRHLALNLAVAAAGALACVLTIYPSHNDAAVPPSAPSLADLGQATLTFARPFAMLMPPAVAGRTWATMLLGLLLLGSLAGLARSRAALVAGVAGLWSYSLFFQLTVGSGYRHQALVLAFLLTLHWLVADRRPPPPLGLPRLGLPRLGLPRLGQLAFLLLLAAQIPATIDMLVFTARGGVVSRSADLGRLVRARGLEDAAVIAIPDVLAEPLAYYLPNPVWLVRERRWSPIVRFSKEGLRPLDLDTVLAQARAVAVARRKPVLILAGRPLDPVRGTRVPAEGFTGPFTATPDQVRRFHAATQRLAAFAPAATDESYDVYLLPAP